MAEYISVSEALKLVSPFKEDKKEVLAFISNVYTAFEVTDPENPDVLYKCILTRISGEPRVAISHRNLENLEELRTFLKNTYTEKRTLGFHATQLFGARRARMITFLSGFRASKSLAQNFGRQPCRTAGMMSVWEL